MKTKYREGPEVREEFERTMTALFRATLHCILGQELQRSTRTLEVLVEELRQFFPLRRPHDEHFRAIP